MQTITLRSTKLRNVIIKGYDAPPVRIPVILHIDVPGSQYVSVVGVQTGGAWARQQNTVTRPVGIFNYTEPTSSAGIQRYAIGWQDQPYNPPVACTITITQGSDLTLLKLGMSNDNYIGWAGPWNTNNTLQGFYIKGTGGIYTVNAGVETLVAATAPLAVGDQIGLKVDNWQYSQGAIKLNGVETVAPAVSCPATIFVQSSWGLIPDPYIPPMVLRWRTSARNNSSSVLPNWVSSVAYGNGRFVVVGNRTSTTNGYAEFSTDNGQTWTGCTTPPNFTSSLQPTVTAYGAGLFVTMIAESITTFFTSPDGVTWTSRTKPSSTTRGMAFLNGRFYAGKSSANTIQTSTDGITFTSLTMPASRTWSVFEYTGTTIVSAHYSGNGTSPAVAVSTDGTTFSNGGTPPREIIDMAYGNGILVGLTVRGAGIFGNVATFISTDNGTTWGAESSTITTTSNYGKIIFDSGKFYLFVSNNVVRSSTDGMTWITETSTITYSNNSSVASDGSGHVVAISAATGTAASYGTVEEL